MIANVDFVTLWNSFLATVEGVTNVTGLFTIAAYVGLVIIIAAIVRWAWQKRKGGRIVENRDGSLLASDGRDGANYHIEGQGRAFKNARSGDAVRFEGFGGTAYLKIGRAHV